MKLTPELVYAKLVDEDKIKEKIGQIKFHLDNVDIIVKQKDVVGNIIQEWLEGWFKSRGIEYLPNPNTQMPPDFFLDPDDLEHNLLEIKAFNRKQSPGFDIADFNSYQEEIICKPYMLHVKYLIFGYVMQDNGDVEIKDVWLENVWNLCRPMSNYALNLQVKSNVINKIRPGVWYTEGKKFKQFDCLEDFISAMEETVYQNPKTHNNAGTWLKRFIESYNKYYNKKLNIERWKDIEDKYIIK